MLRLALVTIAGLAVLIFLGFKFGLIKVISSISSDGDDFDPAFWKSETNFDSIVNVRSQMLDDVMEVVLKPGMKREEARDLLGSPDDNLTSVEGHMGGADIYRIDKDETGIRILVVEYNSEDELTSTRQDNLVQ